TAAAPGAGAVVRAGAAPGRLVPADARSRRTRPLRSGGRRRVRGAGALRGPDAAAAPAADLLRPAIGRRTSARRIRQAGGAARTALRVARRWAPAPRLFAVHKPPGAAARRAGGAGAPLLL